MTSLFPTPAQTAVAVLAMAFCLSAAPPAPAQSKPTPVGKIEWGLWIDDDGCMHWWADGGAEGYMVPRRDPRSGKPVCLKKSTCLIEPTDTLFAPGSAVLTDAGRQRLERFFRQDGVFGYAIHSHTDNSASSGASMLLSERRARSVADVARSVGAVVEREAGHVETQPTASNTTAAGMQQNHRVEIVCYKW